MKWLPFRKKVVDERIEHVRNKLYKETYHLIMLICVASMIIKYAKYGINIDHIVTEFVIAFASSLYIGMRSVFLGLYSDSVEIHDRASKYSMNKKNMIIGIVSAVSLGLIFGIGNSIIFADGLWQSLWYFLIIFVATLMIYVPLFIIVIMMLHNVSIKISNKANKNDSEN